MAKQVQVEDLTEGSVDAQPSWTDMLDPALREARLTDARERRAQAMAARAKTGEDTPKKGSDSAREVDAALAGGKPAEAPRPRAVESRSPADLIEAASMRGEDMATRITTVRARSARRPEVEPVPRLVATPSASAAPPSEFVRTTTAAAPPVTPVPVSLIAEPRVVPAQRRASSNTSLLLGVIFVVGLLGGGVAALLAPPSMRQKIADMIAPTERVASVSTDGPPARDSAPIVTIAPAPMTADPAAPEASGDAVAPVAPRASTRPAGEAAPGPLERPTPPAEWTVPADETPAPPPLDRIDALAELSGSSAPLLPSADEVVLPGVTAPPILRSPSTASPDSLGVLAALPSAPPVPAPASAAASPILAAVDAARVFVHFPPNASAAATAAVEALRVAGVAEANPIPARFSVGSANVRYYHAEDRDAALAIAAIVGADAGGPAPETRDFTSFRPQPNPGMVEIWLAGEVPAGRAPAAQTPARPSVASRPATASPRRAAAPAPARTPTAAQESEAAAVERILLERSIERMLRNRLPTN